MVSVVPDAMCNLGICVLKQRWNFVWVTPILAFPHPLFHFYGKSLRVDFHRSKNFEFSVINLQIPDWANTSPTKCCLHFASFVLYQINVCRYTKKDLYILLCYNRFVVIVVVHRWYCEIVMFGRHVEWWRPKATNSHFVIVVLVVVDCLDARTHDSQDNVYSLPDMELSKHDECWWWGFLAPCNP